MVNSTSKTEGGPFTRYEPADPKNKEKMSTLDLCIVSRDLFKYVDKLVIDKESSFTPFRTSDKFHYTDHFSLLLSLKDLPTHHSAMVAPKKTVRWNTNKANGWETYAHLAGSSTVLLDVAVSSINDPNTLMKNIDREMKSIKYKSFGKVKESAKAKTDPELLKLQKEKKYHFT